MQKKFFQIIALIMALFIFAVTGCGERVEEESVWIDGEGKTSVVTKNNGGTKGNAIDEEGLTDAEGLSDVKSSASFNMKGAEIVIAAWGADDPSPKPTDSDYQEKTKLISDIEKKYNCKIKFKGVTDSMSYLAAWVAAAQSGVKFADICQFASSWIYPQHMKNGYLTPLDDYINVKDDIFNQSGVEQMKYNGKHYAVIMANRFFVGSGVYFNKSVLSKFGVTDTPDKLVAKNNWNWDSFLNIARKCTQASGGTNYYGYAALSPVAWAESNGGVNIREANGKKVYDPDEKYIKGLQFIYDLYNTHNVMPKDGTTFDDGNVAMTIDRYYNAQKHGESLGYSNVGFTYIPHGPDVNDYQIKVDEITAFGIPSVCKQPDVAAAILYDYMYPYKWRGTAEENSESSFGDAASLSVYLDIGNRGMSNMKLTPLYSYITRTIGWGDFGITKQTSPQAYLESVKAMAQSELDSIWDQ